MGALLGLEVGKIDTGAFEGLAVGIAVCINASSLLCSISTIIESIWTWPFSTPATSSVIVSPFVL